MQNQNLSLQMEPKLASIKSCETTHFMGFDFSDQDCIPCYATHNAYSGIGLRTCRSYNAKMSALNASFWPRQLWLFLTSI